MIDALGQSRRSPPSGFGRFSWATLPVAPRQFDIDIPTRFRKYLPDAIEKIPSKLWIPYEACRRVSLFYPVRKYDGEFENMFFLKVDLDWKSRAIDSFLRTRTSLIDGSNFNYAESFSIEENLCVFQFEVPKEKEAYLKKLFKHNMKEDLKSIGTFTLGDGTQPSERVVKEMRTCFRSFANCFPPDSYFFTRKSLEKRAPNHHRDTNHREMNEEIEAFKTEPVDPELPDIEVIPRDTEDLNDLIYSTESTYSQNGSLPKQFIDFDHPNNNKPGTSRRLQAPHTQVFIPLGSKRQSSSTLHQVGSSSKKAHTSSDANDDHLEINTPISEDESLPGLDLRRPPSNMELSSEGELLSPSMPHLIRTPSQSSAPLSEDNFSQIPRTSTPDARSPLSAVTPANTTSKPFQCSVKNAKRMIGKEGSLSDEIKNANLIKISAEAFGKSADLNAQLIRALIDDRIVRITGRNNLIEDNRQKTEVIESQNEEIKEKNEEIKEKNEVIKQKEAIIAQQAVELSHSLDEQKFLEEEINQLKSKHVDSVRALEEQIFSLKRELRKERFRPSDEP
ncbi:Oidioi.mRNA.OKI2018_I69.chr2.g5673.t1.cds [Oikopleura dioica]|uniref:Oidioi.mRNA.OKI2018_I69.chr2.g5673.t1.cds n=1 Tax=Oikopleura dioica TaxID=34765 RepID=A0ABN7T2S5_OIKDI|nr:Oidioi.mRNA.OKI2018_I69.chr2.g5673.t1.cds [Oikopleura dioica]